MNDVISTEAALNLLSDKIALFQRMLETKPDSERFVAMLEAYENAAALIQQLAEVTK